MCKKILCAKQDDRLYTVPRYVERNAVQPEKTKRTGSFVFELFRQ